MTLVDDFFLGFIFCSTIYFFFVNTFFLFLMGASIFTLRNQEMIKPLLEGLKTASSPFAPSISILAPAYNEEKSVVDSVRSFLLLDYPSFEVIVINDGSKDKTLQKLLDGFSLEQIKVDSESQLGIGKVRGVYRSKLHPHLIVIDKENGGKADALNVGIDFAQHDIFCAVDSDSLLESEALLKVSAPFLEEPDSLVASGGTIRIVNGARVKFGRVDTIELPTNFILLMQIIEYTRAFLCGRIGWNVLNSTLVISGAFGLFSKKVVREIGGYSKGCVGEDMELILRLHRYCRDHKMKYKIRFVPDPVCWTEAPSDWKSLGVQRERWQRGLADCLLRNRSMILNPRYGAVGLLALPYFFLVDLLGPVFEIGSLILVLMAPLFGVFDGQLFLAFFCASILYSAVLSMVAVIVEEVYFSKYSKPSQFLTLFFICLIEGLIYRQIFTYWRLKGLWKYMRGDHSWGQLTRAGF